MIEEAFGNYAVVARLGEGGMGVVYLAEHRQIARRAAIKVLSPELSRDAKAVQRFFNEARATSLARHPGIVEVFDCDIDAAGRAYMVMEHLEGETLAARLARVGQLGVDDACVYARRIADAVASAHEAGIVHRDLKPENVFLVGADMARRARDTPVKVLDFGIAKLLSPEPPTRTMTRPGSLLGTPAYMSPEQCEGASTVDHRTDVYALGCILFEMICGRPPFTEGSLRTLLAAHTSSVAPLVSELVPTTPHRLDRLIAQMLAKTPADRPATMRAVALSLEVDAWDDFDPVRDAPTCPALTAVPAPSLPLPALPRRAHAMVAAGGGVVAVAALCAYLLLPAHRSRGATSPAPAVATGRRLAVEAKTPTETALDSRPGPEIAAFGRATEGGPTEGGPIVPADHRRRAPSPAPQARHGRAPRLLAPPPHRSPEPQPTVTPVEMDGIVDL